MLGEEAQLIRAIELAGLDDAAADQASLELVRLEVLRPGIKVQFVHPVVRSAIYDSIPAPERVRLHRAAIEIMKRVSAPATLIANHLLRVDPANDPETVSLLRQAAVMAAAGGDSRSASMLMRRALEEPPPEEQLTGILAQLGAAEMLIDAHGAIEHLGAAFERIKEPSFKVAVAELLARSLVMQERIDEAVQVTERTLATLGPEDEQLRRRTDVVLVETSLVNVIAFPKEYLERCRELLAEADTEG